MTNRQQRRHFDRALRKLIKGDNCSLCSTEFQHNSRTFGGFDQRGKIALVGECCVERLHEIHTAGLFLHHNYDFLAAGQNPCKRGNSVEQIAHALDTFQQIIIATDNELKDIPRRGGVNLPPHAPIAILDHPWKTDDRDWFERHPERSHRARFPFSGEVELEQFPAPEGHRLLLLIRQVEPGRRIRVGFFINSKLLPVPDDAEAVAHALFDVAAGREPIPPNGAARRALLAKYQTQDVM